MDKITTCTKIVVAGGSLLEIDEQFQRFTNNAKQMESMHQFYDIGPVRIDMSSLYEQIKNHSCQWKNVLGQILIENTLDKMKSMQSKIMVTLVTAHFNLTKIVEPKRKHLICFTEIESKIASKNKFTRNI